MWVRRVAAAFVGAAVIAGCGSDDNPFAGTPCSPTASKWVSAKPPADLPVAPESKRVDREAPSFSNPTNVTNPLHPSSALRSALLLGEAEGEPLRVEVTLLRRAKTIPCGGHQVKTLESQYVAFLDGRIHEVALDWYAQDDDGAVWYFGEDVFNFEDGVVSDTEGTWMAGRDGPAAMIMPADPEVGDVYRPENIPGLVFEEVTVKETGKPVDGPRGRVEGAVVVGELHQDGKRETKTFAPGYGEFATGAGSDFEAIALAVPTDASSGPVPSELATLIRGADAIFLTARSRDWNQAESTTRRLVGAWDSYRARGLPPLLEQQATVALRQLTAAVAGRSPVDLRQAAIDLGQAALDLLLQYRTSTAIDRARFALWTRQVRVDALARDEGAVRGDVATLERILDRFSHTLPESTNERVRSLFDVLRRQLEVRGFAGVRDTAARLRKNAASFTSP